MVHQNHLTERFSSDGVPLIHLSPNNWECGSFHHEFHSPKLILIRKKPRTRLQLEESPRNDGYLFIVGFSPVHFVINVIEVNFPVELE